MASPLPLVAAMALVAVLAATVLVATALLTQGDAPTRSAASGGSSPGPTGVDASRPSVTAAVELDPLPPEVPRMRPVPLTGTVRQVPPGTRLVVQELTGSGTWASFPLRPVVDDRGRFRTYVELGAAGVHRLRVVEPRGVVTSAVLEVRVR